MPQVNWDAFAQLPGSSESNFEALCRALIRRHYGRYGLFAALAAQPGVEFHLRLQTPCSLGDPGRWYGWQCRWYDLPSGRALGTTRRRKIEEAIEMTERKLPDLTDWVLWTRRPLTEGDQEWFFSHTTHMRLHLWTAVHVEEHLSGEAEILRGTYFGELILTPDALANQHQLAVARILQRWQPQVHQTVDAERVLRRVLSEASKWDSLRIVAEQLHADAAAVARDISHLTGALSDETHELVDLTRNTAGVLIDIHATLVRGDLDLLRQQLATPLVPPRPQVSALPHRLRAKRKPAALTVTNALADVRQARELLDEVKSCLDTRLVAVVAEAGCGKTELSAQLTAAVGDRPAGILLHGADLNAGNSLDDLAHRVVIQGRPVPSMEALVAAVDSAGQRAHQRFPIVIDGLNEAEDPRDWKPILASLNELLHQYPYVLAVCTVRSAFADDALPADVSRLSIPHFGRDAIEAIGRYFDYYKINAPDAELPLELLRHPLTLRLFCEVTNPTRANVVGIEAMPGSLTSLFDRYLEQASERIVELAPHTQRYYRQDVRHALDEIGAALWEERARSLDVGALRRNLGDNVRPWDESIVCALEQNGVLLRVPGETATLPRVAIVYDMLAGHLVANALLSRQGRTGLETWLRDPATIPLFAGQSTDRHPLGTDIFRALAALVPRRLYRQQLWPQLDEPLRTQALWAAADLEAAYLDAQTLGELATLAAQPGANSQDLFYRLWQTRGAPVHPLNAEFLDRILRPMPVAFRDLRWTEWVRHNQEWLLADLRRLEKRWYTKEQRSPADRLRARWVMWILTSTVRQLRDQATRVLYSFGRGDPSALFELALDSLSINDPYISERMLAASYGIAMAHQLPDPEFIRPLRDFLNGTLEALTGSGATHPTNHWLARLHVQGTVTLALAYHRDAIPEGLEVGGRVIFAPGPTVDPIANDDARAEEVGRTIRMDFENYTLGRLFDDRRNYDMTHSGHQAAIAYVRGTVWALGWRESGLGAIDKDLVSHGSRHDQAPTERYGKKYGWIGYYTYAGQLHDVRQSPRDNERLSDVDIDPSFPTVPAPAPIKLPVWARTTPADDRKWIRQGIVTIPDDLLYRSDIEKRSGPWICVHGYLNSKDQAPGRKVFGVLTALLVARANADRLVDALNIPGYSHGQWPPEVPSDIYTFSGEIPWSPQFAGGGFGVDSNQLYRGIIEVDRGTPIEVEILAHRYAWEGYHSVLNVAGGALVPSRIFSAAFDLRGIPQSFDQALPNGTTAAVSLCAPADFEGHLLYLREDLLHQYASGRRLVWFIWGERQLYPFPFSPPDWLKRARQARADTWQHVRGGEELSYAFKARRRTGTRRSAR